MTRLSRQRALLLQYRWAPLFPIKTLSHREAFPPVKCDDRLLHSPPLALPQQRAVALVGVGQVDQSLTDPEHRTENTGDHAYTY